MSGDIPVFSPQDRLPQPPVIPPDNPAVAAPEAPSPEQAKAIEATFAQTDENANVAALLGFWTSAMLLNDLAQEAYEQTEESLDQPRRKSSCDAI